MTDEWRDPSTTAELRGELFGVHIPELQLSVADYRDGLAAAKLGAGERYLELGSGHGRGLLVAASEFGAHATGVEYLEDAIERSERAAAKAEVSDRVDVVRDDLRRIDPTAFDVVHMHLGPAFHDVLAGRMERLLAQHARVVAAGWKVPGWLPDADAAEQWGGGYVYRPADPRMQASWGELGQTDELDWIELHVHADLDAIEVRVDSAPAGAIALDRVRAARGTTVLVQRPASGELAVWARCRAGRFTQRGPAWRA
ncbi:MAG: arsenite S-adenosylmethyltransferase [Thermoleophilia bacterium]|nr:arsenite S-adenosylmethyltransferase [Thermoleophilia bacterium]